MPSRRTLSELAAGSIVVTKSPNDGPEIACVSGNSWDDGRTTMRGTRLPWAKIA